ncbi:hypothetical protein L1887_09329 [Cichorium endivia]|nr:hypothetical protein L1887_09329 [Cichorium endivia]
MLVKGKLQVQMLFFNLTFFFCLESRNQFIVLVLLKAAGYFARRLAASGIHTVPVCILFPLQNPLFTIQRFFR